MKKFFVTLHLLVVLISVPEIILSSVRELVGSLAEAEMLYKENGTRSSLRALSKQRKELSTFLRRQKQVDLKERAWLLAKCLSLHCSTGISVVAQSGLPLDFTINGESILQRALAVDPQVDHEDDLVRTVDELLFYKARVLVKNKYRKNSLYDVEQRLNSVTPGTRMHRVYSEVQDLLERSAAFERFMAQKTRAAQIFQIKMYALGDWVKRTGFN